MVDGEVPSRGLLAMNSSTELAFMWLAISFALFALTAVFRQIEKKTRGPGSWYTDRALILGMGACLALGIAALSLGVWNLAN